MRLPTSWFRSPQPPPGAGNTPLTRKAFYDLAAETRTIAERLANFDQHRVRLEECHQFNAWLKTVKQYDRLAPYIGDMAPARPIARWQILIIGILVRLLLFLLIPAQIGPVPGSVFIYGYAFTLILVFFVPEGYYGTTVELLEAKMLRVAESLEAILQSQSLEFSHAAYFQVKENLIAAKRELRQQIDLAHRP